MITIRLVKHPGPFQVAVQIAQYGFWASHCDALMPDGELLGARFVGGVQSRPGDYDKGGFTREHFIRIPATPGQTDSFHHFLRAQIGKPFDTFAILAFATQRDWQSPDRWFCSELQAAGLVAAGIFPEHLAIGFARITPRDVLMLSSGVCEKEQNG